MKIIENRKKYFIFSTAIILIGIASMIINALNGNGALNVDVDFSGGTALTFDIAQPFENNNIVNIVKDAAGVPHVKVQKVIGSFEASVLTKELDEAQRNAVTLSLLEHYPNSQLLSFADMSASVSVEMRRNAIFAVVLSCIAMLIYISARFRDINAGASAIVALIHDALVVFSVYTLFRVPINASFIAAVLTILGYSVNATIIIFDRVRENKRLGTGHALNELMNRSIRQTMVRTINTSFTTLAVIICVMIFGVKSVREFAFPITVGVVCGAYSSIFIASSVWYQLSTRSPKTADSGQVD